MKRIIDYIIAIYLWLISLMIVLLATIYESSDLDSPEVNNFNSVLIILLLPAIFQFFIGYLYLKGKNFAKKIIMILLIIHIIFFNESLLKLIPIVVLIMVLLNMIFEKDEQIENYHQYKSFNEKNY